MKKITFSSIITLHLAFSIILTGNSILAQVATVSEQSAKNRDIAKRLVDCFNTKDLSIIDAIFSDSIILNGRKVTIADIRGAVTWWITRFPDLKVTAEPMIAENSLTGFWYKAEGTQQVEFNGIPATNKSVSWTGFDLLRISDGKIVEGWFVADRLGIAQKLGAKLQLVEEKKQ